MSNNFGQQYYKFIEKNRLFLITILVFVIGIGILVYFWSNKNQNSKVSESIIRAEINGAIKKPGVYNLEKGKIVEDLIKIAGGINDTADSGKIATDINRAEILSDGQKVFIPTKSNISSSNQQIAGNSISSNNQLSSSQSSGSNTTGKININTANLSQLDSLPGIGPTYAQRIIDYRNQNNKFKTIEEIKNIKGIGDKTFEKFKDLISI